MDCLEYLKKIPDNFIDLVVTDPPYNVSQKSNINYKNINIVKNFGNQDFDFDPIPVLKELKRVLKPNGQIQSFSAEKEIILEASETYIFTKKIRRFLKSKSFYIPMVDLALKRT